jgi:metal-dependent amidase/aminoacylase/carboxypeptidase family protein
MPIRNRFAELLPEITAWRRDLHEHPELLFETHRTAGIVAEKLREFGCDEVVTGIGRTGVVGVIKGKTDTSGRVVGLRADMDALPIIEATDLPYASKDPGLMHACGHDGHTAMLLGAAKYLAETRNFDGTAVVIFQPAEEGGGGGREMVDDGMMDRFGIQEVYGMHNMPGPAGRAFRDPARRLLCRDRQFEIVLEGKGGHAAKPHETVDTTVMAAQLVLALQTIAVAQCRSAEADRGVGDLVPDRIRRLQRDPAEGDAAGTIRTHDAEIRALAESGSRRSATSIAGRSAAGRGEAHAGLSGDGELREQTDFAAEVAKNVAGDVITDTPRSWGARISPICWRSGRGPISWSATATRRWCTTRPTISTTTRFRPGAAGMRGSWRSGCRRPERGCPRSVHARSR